VRLAVYNDDVYRPHEGAIWTDRTFPMFMAELRHHVERLVILGRLDPAGGTWHFRLPADLEFVGLPHYSSLASPRAVVGGALASCRRFWRALEGVDVVWLLGPHPLGFLFALLARLRGKRVVLGVRQELSQYAVRRHPRRRWLHALAGGLEAGWRLLSRGLPVVVVGSELARQYARGRRVLELTVSMVRDRDLAPSEVTERRSYDGDLRILSVGRLDAEKNPLLLADVLARLSRGERHWRLVVCGTGPMESQLAHRLQEVGVADRAELRGYLPVDAGLLELYRESHAFLHVSWTEGVPQVLFEAFASRVPLVATAVGGVAGVTGEEAAVLIPPGDAEAAATALERVAGDPDLRGRLISAGIERVRARTFESEARRVAQFLRG
jgi:glycosyltransferase involved in cell wall biosynthesis